MNLNIPNSPPKDPEEEDDIRLDFIDQQITPCLITLARMQLENSPYMTKTNSSGVTRLIRDNEKRPSTSNKTRQELVNQNPKESADLRNPSPLVNWIQRTQPVSEAPTFEAQLPLPNREQYRMIRLSRIRVVVDQYLMRTGILGTWSNRDERQNSPTEIWIGQRRIQIPAMPESLTHNMGTAVGTTAEISNARVGTAAESLKAGLGTAVGPAAEISNARVGTAAENSNAGLGTAVGTTAENSNGEVAATKVTGPFNSTSAEEDELCCPVTVAAHRGTSAFVSGNNNANLPSSSLGSLHSPRVPLESDADDGESELQKQSRSRKRKLESDEPKGPKRDLKVPQNLLEDLQRIDQMWASIQELNILFGQMGPNYSLLNDLDKVYRGLAKRQQELVMLNHPHPPTHRSQEGPLNLTKDEDLDMNDSD